MKSRSRDIGSLDYSIALKFDKRLSSSAADVQAKFKSHREISNTKLVALTLHKILR